MSVRENNYKWISTLRGFAALLVFTAHLPIPLPHVVNFAIGRTGVALFFLIMGYLAVQSRRKRTKRPSKRFLCLLPRTSSRFCPPCPALARVPVPIVR